jgi:thiol-disulfide isomerase/thioredoxin
MKQKLKTKLLLATLIIAVAHFNAFSQVQFLKSSIQEAFIKAKTENKAVFIEIYADGCHHCEAFEKTFSGNKAVGDFYNKKYISYQFEVNSEEVRQFRKDMNIYVMSTPLMTFWSTDSTMLSILPAGDEQNNEQGILDFGEKALEPQYQWEAQKKAFHGGENYPNFLINIAYLARYTSDTLLNLAAMKKYAEYLSSENFRYDGFLVIQKVLMDDENLLFMNCVNHLDEYQSKYGRKVVNEALENIVMFSLYSSRGSNYSISKLEFMKTVLRKIGMDENSIRGRFLMPEARLLLKSGNKEQVKQKFIEYVRTAPKLSKEELEFIKKYLSENQISTNWLNEY